MSECLHLHIERSATATGPAIGAVCVECGLAFLPVGSSQGPEGHRAEVYVLMTYEPCEGGTLCGVYETEEDAQLAVFQLEFQPTYAVAHRVSVGAAPEHFRMRGVGPHLLATFCSDCHGEPVRCPTCGNAGIVEW